MSLERNMQNLALSYAVQYGNVTLVKFLLDSGADIHYDNDYALRYASETGNTKLVELLLISGADVHAMEDYALRYASGTGNVEIVKLLLDFGADVNYKGHFILSSLGMSSNNGHSNIVTILLEYVGDVNMGLLKSSRNGYYNSVRVLLKFPHSTEVINTSLELSVRYGHLSIVKILVEYGADLSGDFSMAHPNIVDYLASKGAYHKNGQALIEQNFYELVLKVTIDPQYYRTTTMLETEQRVIKQRNQRLVTYYCDVSIVFSPDT